MNNLVDATSTPTLQIFLLGRFSILLFNKELPADAIRGRKARTLLKLLALRPNNQMIRDQILEALWPNLDMKRGAAQLYKSIHHIRRALSQSDPSLTTEEWIEITEDLVRLTPPGDFYSDIQEFERLAQFGLQTGRVGDLSKAIALYTGDLLPMDLYANWADSPREHLRQLYLDLLLALGEQQRIQGTLMNAAESFRTALQKDPLLEEAHRGLMRIYAQQGQRNRAVRQYRTCLDTFRRELQMKPSDETQALAEAMQKQDFSAEISVVHSEIASPVSLPPLINREEECRLIEAFLEQVRDRRGCVLLIEGSMGIGKTRLTQQIVFQARQHNYQSYVGKSRDMGGSIAYSPFIQIIESALNESLDDQDLLPHEFTQAIPGYSGNAQHIPTADRRAAQGYLFAQFVEFLTRRAMTQPVLVILEDMHAADKGSLSFLQYLMHKIQKVPVFLVVTCRIEEGEGSSEIKDWLGELPVTTRLLSLGPLAEVEHLRLLRQLSDQGNVSPKVNHEIYLLSEGVPLFAEELFQVRKKYKRLPFSESPDAPFSADGSPELREAIPPSLQSVVAKRLSKLNPEARSVLYMAAVAGRTVGFELLSTIWKSYAEETNNQSEDHFLDILDVLVENHLLEERGLNFSFRHALFQAAVYASVSAARRSVLHDKAARGLLRIYEGRDNQPVEQIAFHFYKAGDSTQAAHYLILAAERAEAAFAHDDALNRYRQAFELLESLEDAKSRRVRSKISEHLGDIYRLAGYIEKSFEAYEQALSLVAQLPVTRLERAELHRKLALSDIYVMAMQDAYDHLDKAWELGSSEKKMQARILTVRALYYWHFNELEKAIELAHKALKLAESIKAIVEEAQACEMLAMAYLPLGKWKQGLQFELRRRAQGWSPEIVLGTDAHLCLWEFHVHGDEPFDRAMGFMQEVSDEASRLGALRCVAICHYAIGTMHIWRGNSAKAIEYLETSLDLHQRVGSPAGMAYTLARKAALHTIEGAYESGWNTIAEGLSYAKQAAVGDHCLQRLYGVATWNRIESKEWQAVERLVDESETLLTQKGLCPWCSLELVPWLTYYHLDKKNLDTASRHVENLSTLSDVMGNLVGKAVSCMMRSGVAAAKGEKKAAIGLRKQAEKMIQASILQGSNSSIMHFFDRMLDQQKHL